MSEPELEPRPGWVADDVRAEYPELRLLVLPVDARPTRSPPEVRQRLRDLSDRFRGRAGGRHAAQPGALGLPRLLPPDRPRPRRDPHADRGRRGRPPDPRRMALGQPGRRRADHRAGRDRRSPVGARRRAGARASWGSAPPPPASRSGARRPSRCACPRGDSSWPTRSTPLAVLFGDLANGHGVDRHTARMLLFTISVAGVPRIHVEEALYSCAETPAWHLIRPTPPGRW